MQPQQRFRILRQSHRADAGNCQEMQEGRFAQREFFDETHNGQRVCWPSFAELK
jgi:hypothetical protein